MYEPMDDATLRTVAAWLRRLAPEFTPRPRQKMLTVAALVESRNDRAALLRSRAVPSKAPERAQKVA